MDGYNYDGEVEVCNLDVDDTSSYGSETITLNATTDKPYYYIHHYSGTGSLSTSGAEVNVYRGEVLLATYQVPTDQNGGRYWNVFAIVDGELTIRNTITSSPDISYADLQVTPESSVEILLSKSDMPEQGLIDIWKVMVGCILTHCLKEDLRCLCRYGFSVGNEV